MPFVSVVPIIVPLCSIYLWCNQNLFKRILQRINTIYSGRFNRSTTNCSLGSFAKSLDGLPRAWVRITPTPPTMAISSRRNPRAFLCFGAMMVFRENLFIMLSAIARNKIFVRYIISFYGNQERHFVSLTVAIID